MQSFRLRVEHNWNTETKNLGQGVHGSAKEMEKIVTKIRVRPIESSYLQIGKGRGSRTDDGLNRSLKRRWID